MHIRRIHVPSFGTDTQARPTSSSMNSVEQLESHTFCDGVTNTRLLLKRNMGRPASVQSESGSLQISNQGVGTQNWTKKH